MFYQDSSALGGLRFYLFVLGGTCFALDHILENDFMA